MSSLIFNDTQHIDTLQRREIYSPENFKVQIEEKNLRNYCSYFVFFNFAQSTQPTCFGAHITDSLRVMVKRMNFTQTSRVCLHITTL